ncbi:MAG TPA: glycosyltransferase family 4 protein, partial [Baekduia sp.]
MSPDLAVVQGRPRGGHLALVPRRPLRVADVALFYGGGSGGIRTYLDAKAAHAASTGEIEHHVLVPGARERHEGGRHELPSLRLIAANGYRLPFGAGALKRTLRELRPDVVLLHDPFWWPLDVVACAREVGARTVAVHHGTSTLEAAALPGPSRLYAPLLRGWLRRASRHVDAVMSNVDTMADCGRLATMPLRLGVHEAFRPRADV